jgi:hypothetical protein
MGWNEFLFLLRGLQWTLALSAIGFAFGAVAGLAVALARISGSKPLERTMAAYIAVFQGTPLLMQLPGGRGQNRRRTGAPSWARSSPTTDCVFAEHVIERS